MIEYALLIMLILHVVVINFRLRDVKRHDIVLFRFCEIRRQLITLIFDRESSGIMTNDEYRVARQLLVMLNHLISEYYHRRTRMFDFRTFRHFLPDYEKTADQLESFVLSENQSLRTLYTQTHQALVLAFFAYTPFLRSEFILRFFLFLFQKKVVDSARPFRDAERFGVKGGDLALLRK